jgi:hypothetical protein
MAALIRLLRASPLADSEKNQFFYQGLEGFMAFLANRIDRTNAAISQGFLKVQADIYGLRQLVLDNSNASNMSTSPVLGQIAAGERAPAVREDIQKFSDWIKANTK